MYKLLFALALAGSVTQAEAATQKKQRHGGAGRIRADEDKLRAFVGTLKLPSGRAEIVTAAKANLPDREANYVSSQLSDKRFYNPSEVLVDLGLNADESND